MRQCDARNLSMVMDLYEMTMSNGYFCDGNYMQKVAFDVFYRKNPDRGGFAIFAGLEQIIEFIQELHFSEADIEYFRSLKLFSEEFLLYLKDFSFKGDMYAFPEGTIMYPNEPVITVVAPVIDAQLIETAILLEFNHQSLVATKARRIVRSADGRAVSDFGARRAHNIDAAVYGARAAFIGGAASTATVLAGQMLGIPVSGTMAHSWVMRFEDEYTAFCKYAEVYPDSCVLLIDTYDVLNSGIKNAIRTAEDILKPLGKRLKGVRIDSGDLAYLSKKCRKILDEAGLSDCMIVASNSLDEYTIQSLLNQGACIDSFGVGERLITSRSEPVFGAVYKLCAVEKDKEFIPKIKVSENEEKITNPGLKRVYRVYDEEGKVIADLIALADEKVDFSSSYRYVDPKKPWKNRFFENCTVKELATQIFKDGELVYNVPGLSDVASYVRSQLSGEIWEEEQRFENPHTHYVDMSPAMYELKMSMLHECREISANI